MLSRSFQPGDVQILGAEVDGRSGVSRDRQGASHRGGGVGRGQLVSALLFVASSSRHTSFVNLLFPCDRIFWNNPQIDRKKNLSWTKCLVRGCEKYVILGSIAWSLQHHQISFESFWVERRKATEISHLRRWNQKLFGFPLEQKSNIKRINQLIDQLATCSLSVVYVSGFAFILPVFFIVMPGNK